MAGDTGLKKVMGPLKVGLGWGMGGGSTSAGGLIRIGGRKGGRGYWGTNTGELCSNQVPYRYSY